MSFPSLFSKMSGTSSIFRLSSIISAQRGWFTQKLCVPQFTQSAGLKKSIEERLGYPDKPRRPLTPYFRYITQIRPKLVEEHPKATFGEITKLAALMWEKVEPQIKAKLEEEYKKDHGIYLKNKIEHEKTVSAEQKDDIKIYRAAKEEQKLKKDLKKKMRELGKPKKPTPAFLRFLKSMESSSRGDLDFRAWQVKASQMWNELDVTKKQDLLDESSKLLEVYKRELHSWEEKMIRLGHANIVRNKALVHAPINRSSFRISTILPNPKPVK